MNKTRFTKVIFLEQNFPQTFFLRTFFSAYYIINIPTQTVLKQ